MLRQAKYVGPIGHLQGETALIQECGSVDIVKAQFDNTKAEMELTIGGQILRIRLGYMWHRFHRVEFEDIQTMEMKTDKYGNTLPLNEVVEYLYKEIKADDKQRAFESIGSVNKSSEYAMKRVSNTKVEYRPYGQGKAKCVAVSCNAGGKYYLTLRCSNVIQCTCSNYDPFHLD